jgi:hypothetical protein
MGARISPTLPSIGTGVAAVWAAQDTKNHMVIAIASIGYALLLSIKGYVGKRPRTGLSLTKAGRSALEGHLAALKEIVSKASLVKVEATDA